MKLISEHSGEVSVDGHRLGGARLEDCIQPQGKLIPVVDFSRREEMETSLP
jgi:hypothetical protein